MRMLSLQVDTAMVVFNSVDVRRMFDLVDLEYALNCCRNFAGGGTSSSKGPVLQLACDMCWQLTGV